MTTHLAVATDFSEISKNLVHHLDDFRDLGAERITLMHVREVGYPISEAATDQTYYDEKLRKTADELADRGWEVETRHEKGRPGPKLVAMARDVDADMIVLGNKGHGAVGEVLLGSVAGEVLELTDRPVFLFCRGAADEDRSLFGDAILHPTDFASPADAALEQAGKIAADRKLPVTLYNVCEPEAGDANDARKACESELTDRKERLEDAGVAEVTVECAEGRAKRSVPERVQDDPGALVVMGTRGKKAFAESWLGGVTRRIARLGSHHMLVTPGD